jgi:hypothetical protein
LLDPPSLNFTSHKLCVLKARSACGQSVSVDKFDLSIVRLDLFDAEAQRQLDEMAAEIHAIMRDKAM